MISATWWEIASQHLVSFGSGLVVGFALTSRYRVIRRNGNGAKPDDHGR